MSNLFLGGRLKDFVLHLLYEQVELHGIAWEKGFCVCRVWDSRRCITGTLSLHFASV